VRYNIIIMLYLYVHCDFSAAVEKIGMRGGDGEETRPRARDGVAAHISFGTLCRPGHQFYFCHEYISYDCYSGDIWPTNLLCTSVPHVRCGLFYIFFSSFPGRTNLKKKMYIPTYSTTENAHDCRRRRNVLLRGWDRGQGSAQ